MPARGVSSEYNCLLQHLHIAGVTAEQLVQAGTSLRKHHLSSSPQISTPLARPRRAVQTGDGLPNLVRNEQRETGSPLVLATFGWWEIIVPTVDAVRELCFALATRKVHACAVTGFPAAVVHQVLDGRLGYKWIGELSPDTQSVGMLVAVPWLHSITIVAPQGEADRRRHFFLLPGPLLGVACYGPCTGSIPVADHECWLQQTVDITVATAAHHQVRDVWLLGDFNLRGVAPGPSQPAAAGSSHAKLTEAFKEMLSEVGWHPLWTGATHDRGGGLDIHITNIQTEEAAEVALPLVRCKSDHRLTTACCHKRAGPGAEMQDHRDVRGVEVFEWRRDEVQWRKALCPTQALTATLTASWRGVMARALLQPPRKSLRRAVATAVQVLFDMVFGCAGHAAGLMRRRQIPTRAERDRPRQVVRHLLQDMRCMINQLRSEAEVEAADAGKWEWYQLQKTWLDLATRSRIHMQGPMLQSSWMQAARGGDVTLQRWFSVKAGHTSPRLPMRTDREAREVLEFRARIGTLDGRCDPVAEREATEKMRAEHRLRCSRVKMGSDPPWIEAPHDDDRRQSTEQAVFVNRDTVAGLIRRRSATKSSARLPWAAMRAAVHLDRDHLEMIHTALEITWAIYDVDEASLGIEIDHHHKGQGKPTTATKAYRPLGLVHPLMSLRSDILRIRLAPGLTLHVGETQLGGLRDPRLIVVARQEAQCRRRCMGLPTAELAADARFGFDGGRHCRIMTHVTAAGTADRDWILTHRLLTGHRMQVRDRSDEGCVALLEDVRPAGGGTIQGLSISGLIYNPMPGACDEWRIMSVPCACSSVRPEVLRAFHAVCTQEPAGMWSGSVRDTMLVAWSIERALENLDAGGDQQLCYKKCCQLLASLHTDAERLLVLDQLSPSGGEVSSKYVDDLELAFSSPWALKLGCLGLAAGASHNGIVFEGGLEGKTVATFDGFAKEVTEHAVPQLAGCMQGATPRVESGHTTLGIPRSTKPALQLRLHEEGLQSVEYPAPRGKRWGRAHWPAGRTRMTATLANRSSRLCVLKSITVKGAIGLQVAVSQASSCPWPLLARRYYISRLDAKVAYQLPLAVGVPVAGLRLTGMQARWALAAITGRVSWAKSLKVPSILRRQMCADLGWTCLWLTARSSAISLLSACRADLPCYAHARLSGRGAPLAPGGWMASVDSLAREAGCAPWQPALELKGAARKRSLVQHRRHIVIPALRAWDARRHDLMDTELTTHGSLPWAWIAANGNVTFDRRAFELWWQLRVLGVSFPRSYCPWCQPQTAASSDCSRRHLEAECREFARRCSDRGIQKSEAFWYPPDDEWFTNTLGILDELRRAMDQNERQEV